MEKDVTRASTDLKRAVGGITAIAAVVRILWITTMARAPKGVADPTFYLIFAKRISEGRGYLSISGNPTAYYPPGYPYFLGALRWVLEVVGLGSRMVPVTMALQALMGAATAGMLVVIGTRTTESFLGSVGARRAGITAGLVMAFWPNLIVQTGLMLSEVLFLFVFCGLLVALVVGTDPDRTDSPASTPWLITASCLFALCTLVRPQSTLFLLPVIVLVLSLCRAGIRTVLRWGVAFVVALLLVLTPWTIRNAVRMHAFVPLTTNVGDNLCMGFNPDANGGFAYVDYCISNTMYLDGTDAEVHQNRDKTAKAIRWARHNVLAIPGLSVSKVRITMENDYDALWGLQSFGYDVFLSDGTFAALKRIADTYYKVVLVLAASGTVVMLRRLHSRKARDPRPWIMLCLVPLCLAVPILSFGDPRFKTPLVPSLAILAGVVVGAFFPTSQDHDDSADPSSGPVEGLS